jgi:hypothetical protein
MFSKQLMATVILVAKVIKEHKFDKDAWRKFHTESA